MHRRKHDPWWFSSDGRGRFDLPTPRGTCYLARDATATLLETFKGITLVSDDVLEERRLFEVNIGRSVRLANCCAPRARAFGVNAEIHDTPDYDTTQGWARAFDTAGFDGIRYFVSSDPSRRLLGYALFGEPATADGWPAGRSAAVSDQLLRDAERWGLHVRPTPS